MSAELMSPVEFGVALDRMIRATADLVLLPLDDMAAYVDRIESLGEEVGMTPEQAEAAAHAGRMVAAITYLRATAALGGAR